MAKNTSVSPYKSLAPEREFQRELGFVDAAMIVIGVMVGSGIFIVTADMARHIGSPGWLLVAWLITGALTIAGALSYGELSAMMPEAGGMYVYLREAYSPLWGFLYGWTLFTVIQTGTIAAVSVAFARFSGLLWSGISEDNYVIAPVHVSTHYALSLSTAQMLAIGIIAVLTLANARGLHYGKIVQNVSTTAKTCALIVLIIVGIFFGWNTVAVHENFSSLWIPRSLEPVGPNLDATTLFGLFVAICVSQTGSLFAADSWHNIAFAAGEVKKPERNVMLAMVIGSSAVISLYLLVNIAYLVTLPFGAIQHAPADRVGTTMLQAIFPGSGAALMAAAIMVSTFGTVNALILTGARVYYAMARQGLFFRLGSVLNAANVPAYSLVTQGMWAALLVLPRTFNPATGQWGNLYNNLLEYVISAALLFYIITVAGLFRLRIKRPDAPRPYRTIGFPFAPGAYILGSGTILIVLFVFRQSTTWPGIFIVLLGLPIYMFIRPEGQEDAALQSSQEHE